MNIENIIAHGKENAIGRSDLCRITGLPDRAVRKSIQSARENGALILNDQDGKGYYYATEGDVKAILRQYKQDTARAMAILRRRKECRKILKAAGVKV